LKGIEKTAVVMFPVPPRRISEPLQKPTPLDHKQTISALVQELDGHMNQPLAVNALSTRFSIKVRRLFDFINVLGSIGCCRKSGLDHVVWLGRGQIPAFVQELRRTRDIDNPDRTLSDLFPVSGCVGISNLTVAFILMFHALRTNHIDLRFIGNLFSRQTQRYKSTLCKLYQINYVLCAAGISERTAQVCEVVLLDSYIDFQVVPAEKPEDSGPVQINSLLNRRRPRPEFEFIYRRRKEIYDLFIKSVASKTVVLPDENSLLD
jgi:hypothetical protein